MVFTSMVSIKTSDGFSSIDLVLLLHLQGDGLLKSCLPFDSVTLVPIIIIGLFRSLSDFCVLCKYPVVKIDQTSFRNYL